MNVYISHTNRATDDLSMDIKTDKRTGGQTDERTDKKSKAETATVQATSLWMLEQNIHSV